MKKKKVLNLQEIARSRFGYESLRSGQEAAIQSLLDGRDTLAVMPTGSGKSAIYQLAAFLIPGPTVIISPLVALQQDQVEAISQQNVGDAALVNSTIKNADREEAFENLKDGDLEFLFLAPEQFNNPETLERLQAAKPSLFVVDEAHCISEWGHDFRPDYLRLSTIVEALNHPKILALTATAAPPVREEILSRLGMQNPNVIVQGFDRPNIWLAVARLDDESEKQAALLNKVDRVKKPGIVYVATRKRAEEIANLLSEKGIKASCYHAGMAAKERERVQTAFMNDEVDVLVATTAFGMGVDKPNVRFVFHYEISDSVDSYYQEIGRAGRDGEKALAILFYNPEDLKIRRFLTSKGMVDAEDVEQLVEIVQAEKEPIDLEDLQEKTELSKSKLRTALTHLAEVGVVENLPTGEVISCNESADISQAASLVVQAQERCQQFERSRLEMIRGYAEVHNCRREYLLNYFGENLDEPCGFCDNCKAGISEEEDCGDRPFSLNSRVIHINWGEGEVIRYEADKMVILFDRVGYKTLGADITLLRGLVKQKPKA